MDALTALQTRTAAPRLVEPAPAGAELDAILISLATDPALGPLDLLVVYLPGLDIAQHALLGAADAGGLPASATSARSDRAISAPPMCSAPAAANSRR